MAAGRLPKANAAKDMIGEFVNQVMSGATHDVQEHGRRDQSRIAEIDRLLSAQMNEIMHQEDFQKLEARGEAFITW